METKEIGKMSFAKAGVIKFNADKVGVVASVLCAIHCALTPILLIALPSFGQLWSHPASHWGMAIFVVPIAVVMITVGYRRHRRRWILLSGAIGIACVVIGAAIPYWETGSASSSSDETAMEEASGASQNPEVFTWTKGGEFPEGDDDSEVFSWTAGEEMEDSECLDACCPSLQTDADGNVRLHIPLASVVTTLGGLSLILTHVGNLCCCSGCRGGSRRKL